MRSPVAVLVALLATAQMGGGGFQQAEAVRHTVSTPSREEKDRALSKVEPGTDPASQQNSVYPATKLAVFEYTSHSAVDWGFFSQDFDRVSANRQGFAIPFAIRIRADGHLEWFTRAPTLGTSTCEGKSGLSLPGNVPGGAWDAQMRRAKSIVSFLERAAQQAVSKSPDLADAVVLFAPGDRWDPGRAPEDSGSIEPHPAMLSFTRRVGDPSTIPLPDVEFVSSNGYQSMKKELQGYDQATPWEQRSAELFWRGSQTGTDNGNRYRVCLHSKQNGDGWLNARYTNLGGDQQEMDMIKSNGLADEGGHWSVGDQCKYKYLLDVDGNANAWAGFAWRLGTKESTTFKVGSNFMQWYYPRLQPMVNYIPVKNDLSDIKQQFEWAESHPDEAREIARKGAELIQGMTIETEADFLAQDLTQLGTTCDRSLEIKDHPKFGSDFLQVVWDGSTPDHGKPFMRCASEACEHVCP